MRVGAQRRWRGSLIGPVALLACLAFAVPAEAEFEFLGEFGAPGPGELTQTLDVEGDGAGGFYTVDLYSSEVKRYGPGGDFESAWPVAGVLADDGILTAIGVDPANSRVYVAGASGLLSATSPADVNLKIQRYGFDGTLQGEWGSFGEAEGEFGGIIGGVSVDPFGNVYVADRENHRIQIFEPDGTPDGMWGKDVDPGGGTGPETCVNGCKAGVEGTAEGEMDDPSDVAILGADAVVADADNHRIQRFDRTTGTFELMAGRNVQPGGTGGFETCMAMCGIGTTGTGPGEFDTPEAIATGDSGIPYVAVTDNQDKQVHTLALSTLSAPNAFGSPGTGEGELNAPTGISAEPDHVLVSEAEPARVQRFTKTGTFVLQSGAPALSSLVTPASIAIGDGQALVTSYRHPIARFGLDGGFLGTWGTPFGSAPGEFTSPDGIADDGSGGAYVADRANDRIQHVDRDGNVISVFGAAGADPGQLESPAGIAIGEGGEVFVADRGNDRVQKFSAIGGFLGTWGALGAAPGQFDDPDQVAVGPDGSLFVADSGNDRIQVFGPGGKLIRQWGGEGSGNGQFENPSGVAVDDLGNVFVADSGNHRVQRFSADGAFLGKWGAGGGDGSRGSGNGEFSSPGAVAIGPGGDIFVVDRLNHRIQRFAGADDPGEGTAPRAVLKLPKKASVKRLRKKKVKTKTRCRDAACRVALKGKVRVKIVRRQGKGNKAGVGAKTKKVINLSLKKRSFELDQGAKRKQPVKLKRHKKKTRKLARLLRRKGKVRAKLIVKARAANDAGRDTAKAKTKIKLRKKKQAS